MKPTQPWLYAFLLCVLCVVTFAFFAVKQFFTAKNAKKIAKYAK